MRKMKQETKQRFKEEINKVKQELFVLFLTIIFGVGIYFFIKLFKIAGGIL